LPRGQAGFGAFDTSAYQRSNNHGIASRRMSDGVMPQLIYPMLTRDAAGQAA
jgi:hypothetical protein